MIIIQRQKGMILKDNAEINLMPNLKTLNHVKTWINHLEILISVSRFEPTLIWYRLLAVQRRGSNSLNSASDQ